MLIILSGSFPIIYVLTELWLGDVDGMFPFSHELDDDSYCEGVKSTDLVVPECNDGKLVLLQPELFVSRGLDSE